MSKSELIQVRVPPDLKDKIKAAADAENRSISNYLLNLIATALEDK